MKTKDNRTEEEKREEFDKVLADLDKEFEPRIRAYRESERLTAEDMTLRINARDY